MDEILRPLAETFAKVILGYLADELKARHKESQEVAKNHRKASIDKSDDDDSPSSFFVHQRGPSVGIKFLLYHSGSKNQIAYI